MPPETPGPRRAARAAPCVSGFTFLVTSNTDGGEGTLRAAILNADRNPDSTIDFALKTGSTTINLMSSLPPIYSTVLIDGTSQPGYSGAPLITVNGSGALQGGTGFDFIAGSDGSAIEGLDVTGFAVAAIMVAGASNVTIGGSLAGQGNVISGNPGAGIALTSGGGQGANGSTTSSITTKITIEGNEIGTDSAGTGQVANGVGISIQGATDNTIGGTTAAERNIVSGNTTDGIDLAGSTTLPNTTGNLIAGNKIGTNAAGTGMLPNGVDGIKISAGSTNNTIGGSVGQMNVLSGNTGVGIVISDTGTSRNAVMGNQIGTNAAGTAALANGTGVTVSQGATNNTIGGTTASDRNVISGNTGNGILIAATSGSVVLGNFIGIDATGTTVLGNGTGVNISQGATGNTIGGTAAGDRNVIAGNTGDGIDIDGASANAVLGNYLGLSASGSNAVANNSGIEIARGATSNSIGGALTGEGNVISGNTTAGVAITGAGALANWLAGNLIGTDPSGQTALANGIGVLASDGSATTIGGTTSGAGNIISGNLTAGIELSGASVSGVEITGNLIGTDPTGTKALRVRA